MNGLEAKLKALRDKHHALFHAEARALLDSFFSSTFSPPLLTPPESSVEIVTDGRKNYRPSKRYSAEQREQALVQVIETIRASGPSGREALSKGLGMDDKLLTKALRLGTDSDQIVIVGERRASHYATPDQAKQLPQILAKALRTPGIVDPEHLKSDKLLKLALDQGVKEKQVVKDNRGNYVIPSAGQREGRVKKRAK